MVRDIILNLFIETFDCPRVLPTPPPCPTLPPSTTMETEGPTTPEPQTEEPTTSTPKPITDEPTTPEPISEETSIPTEPLSLPANDITDSEPITTNTDKAMIGDSIEEQGGIS